MTDIDKNRESIFGDGLFQKMGTRVSMDLRIDITKLGETNGIVPHKQFQIFDWDKLWFFKNAGI